MNLSTVSPIEEMTEELMMMNSEDLQDTIPEEDQHEGAPRIKIKSDQNYPIKRK